MLKYYKTILFLVILFTDVKMLCAQTSLNNAQIETLLKEYNIPMLGLGVIQKGRLKHTEVFTAAKASPVSQQILFNVASLTKPVVAVLTLQLVSKGLWDLDEPLSKYWVDPDVVSDQRHKKLTTRHILSHQSGFANWRSSHKSNQLVFHFEPGTRFQYSGEGLEYLRRALEHKFNKSLEALSDSLLFKPLGMKDTRFYWDKNIETSSFAIGHDYSGNPYPLKKESEANAADDLLTTVNDYGKFAVAVLKRFGLSKAVFREMTKAQVTVKDKTYMGLGWELHKDFPKGEYVLLHRGSDSGTRCLVVLLPKSKNGLIILTNSDNGERIFNKLISSNLAIGKAIVERLITK